MRKKDKWGDSVIRVVCEDVSVKGIIDVTKVAPVLTAYEMENLFIPKSVCGT